MWATFDVTFGPMGSIKKHISTSHITIMPIITIKYHTALSNPIYVHNEPNRKCQFACQMCPFVESSLPQPLTEVEDEAEDAE